jgi:hypothetical protein
MIEVKSLADIPTILELLEEQAQGMTHPYASEELVMWLPVNKRFFNAFVTSQGHLCHILVVKAFASLVVVGSEPRYSTNALNHDEGYFADSGHFLAVTSSRETVISALTRFFSQDDYSNNYVVPFEGTVLPFPADILE